MTYYNRPQQFRLTLRSIEYYCKNKEDLEIIIIDDASDANQLASKVVEGINLPIRVVYIPPEKHWWINPCIPFNIGIREAQGEIICLQTPECVHYGGDLLGYVREHLTNTNYLTFSCYIAKSNYHSAFAEALKEPKTGDMLSKIWETISPMEDKEWGNHSRHRPTKYHFLSAITKSNMQQLGGFNELFADGYAFDDDEFLFRVEESGLNVEIVPVSKGFVTHQWHAKSNTYHGGCPEWNKNKERLRKIYAGKRDMSRWG